MWLCVGIVPASGFLLSRYCHDCAESDVKKMKWNESGFRPPLCTYRLNWARRTSWGWWDDWDDTVLQTQDSKFEPWRSEAEHATSRSRRLPTILTFTRGWGRNNFVSFKPPRPGTEPRTLAWKAAVLTTTLGPPSPESDVKQYSLILSNITMRSILNSKISQQRCICSNKIHIHKNCTSHHDFNYYLNHPTAIDICNKASCANIFRHMIAVFVDFMISTLFFSMETVQTP